MVKTNNGGFKKKKSPTNGSKRKITKKSHWGQTAGYGTGTLTLAGQQAEHRAQ